MGQKTTIEWTDATWNPIRGCSRISEGCRNCYAESVAARFSGPGQAYDGLAKRVAVTKESRGRFPRVISEARWTGEVRVIDSALYLPLRWKKPRRIFVNSMSDLFHESVPDSWLDHIFKIIAKARQHTFQILTKRPARMLEYVGPHLKPVPEFLPHVWFGVSVEDQKTADERIPLLLETPAAVRFISAEPLLGPVDLRFLQPNGEVEINALAGTHGVYRPHRGGNAHLDWVICGGESGPRARPMHPDWARALRDQCQAAGMPFFFKQWGAWQPACALYGDPERDEKENGRGELFSVWPTGEIVEDRQPPGSSWLMERIGKKAAGRLLDGREWSEFPRVSR